MLKAWRAVIPHSVALAPVGGIAPESIAPYAAAGASGFGLGSALYRPGNSAADVARKAVAFIQAWHDAYGMARTCGQGAAPAAAATRSSPDAATVS